ncbi:uncharacterized protein LOC116853310 isoform X3 [Odontomachus brunneus]|uniref:uncharacterized protein LOC116853310 isoform X3 n=1 Tax=Odontomachus brunneus TaxID=486640 RepID=UPI0013F28C5C|nr:uncharacterized protein LOC116853310 isoform X3 [Odontomachus brunneus]
MCARRHTLTLDENMGEKMFNLTWNNHLANLSGLFETLYKSGSLTDVTLACQGGMLRAHRLVLAACSPYFERVFKEHYGDQPILILKGVAVEEMECLLDFMYRGSIDVAEEHLPSLIKTATDLEIRGLSGEQKNQEHKRNPYARVEARMQRCHIEPRVHTTEYIKDSSVIPFLPKHSNVETMEEHKVEDIEVEDDPMVIDDHEDSFDELPQSMEAQIKRIPPPMFKRETRFKGQKRVCVGRVTRNSEPMETRSKNSSRESSCEDISKIIKGETSFNDTDIVGSNVQQQVYSDLQPVEISYDASQQSLLTKDSVGIVSYNSFESTSCTSLHINVSCSNNLSNSEDLAYSLPFTSNAPGALSNLNDELKDFANPLASPIKAPEKNYAQQQETQSQMSIVNIQDSEEKNPLLILLQRSGARWCKLVDDSQRNNMVPVGHDIHEIGKITAKHLLSLATPPTRKVSTSTLTKWATYFKRLFPKTPISSFYAFKTEQYRRKDGVIIQKKRADGALQSQLFQARRKLIKENRATLLRRPCKKTAGGNASSSHVVFTIRNTWRPVGRQDEKNVQLRDKILSIEIDPTIQWHLEYLHNQLQNKLTLELVTSWKATFTYRRKQLIDQPGTVWDYLNEFPFLQIQDIGKALISEDFKQICSNAEPITRDLGKLAENLDDRRVAIIQVAKTVMERASQQKQKDIAASFFRLAEKDSDVQLRVTGALLLLPFLFPYACVDKKWKPSRENIVESFIARVCSETEVQKYIECRRKSLFEITTRSTKIPNSVQPYVLAVGPTWEHISHVHVIVDQVLYTCENIIEATELCFKLFHAFHSDYPPESKHVWQLIQQGFFKLFITDHDLKKRTITKALADIAIDIEEEKLYY